MLVVAARRSEEHVVELQPDPPGPRSVTRGTNQGTGYERGGNKQVGRRIREKECIVDERRNIVIDRSNDQPTNQPTNATCYNRHGRTKKTAKKQPGPRWGRAPEEHLLWILPDRRVLPVVVAEELEADSFGGSVAEAGAPPHAEDRRNDAEVDEVPPGCRGPASRGRCRPPCRSSWPASRTRGRPGT